MYYIVQMYHYMYMYLFIYVVNKLTWPQNMSVVIVWLLCVYMCTCVHACVLRCVYVRLYIVLCMCFTYVRLIQMGDIKMH